MVVDDSKVMHTLYDLTLRRYSGCKIVHAMDGKEALALLREHADCELIILDVNMPVMDGLEFLKHYGAGSFARRAPIIVVSTHGRDDERQRGLEAGASAYLTKPFQPTDLQAMINQILG